VGREEERETRMKRSVALMRYQDEGGLRSLDATVLANGDLLIEGQDLGPGVEAVFGEGLREYEYALTVEAADVPALLVALGEETDLLGALADVYKDPTAHGPASLLGAHGIPYTLWTRVGD